MRLEARRSVSVKCIWEIPDNSEIILDGKGDNLVYIRLVKHLHVSAAIELLSFPMGSFGFVSLNFAKRHQIANKTKNIA